VPPWLLFGRHLIPADLILRRPIRGWLIRGWLRFDRCGLCGPAAS
jgi:hypothetical protein